MLITIAFDSDGAADGVLIGLAALPGEEGEADENGQGCELAAVTGLRVSLVEGNRPRESLVTHVEGVEERARLCVLRAQVLVVCGHIDVLARVLHNFS